ncbi:SDR family oxidoreductase [Methylobacterium sp. E-005]|uniref:SDR family oxidoreductase n=1 Tax=Methylobacterium sp. E-005 TaxID=2836549 RepID=UPI001FB97B18|nr:SDR family oxidoreductase [Methylobacterium sp. E-005]MCJ2090845.1 SDR family oxidoreductase [Methylobacterium sp. E-005]
MTMSGQRVAILGGTSGIGLAVAKAVAREGGSPIVVSSTSDRIGAALASLPAHAEGIVLDLRDEAAIRDIFPRIGTFDHLIFTAGESLTIGLVTDLPVEDAKRFFDVRFWGAFAAVKYGAPLIRPGGSIVLTSGIAAAKPPQGGWTLGASVCAAMEGLTPALALELKPIRVNVVSPGFVRTPLWSDIPESEREAMYAAAGERLPVGRVGSPEDLAEAYLFLMREAFATGQTLVVDGGGLVS